MPYSVQVTRWALSSLSPFPSSHSKTAPGAPLVIENPKLQSRPASPVQTTPGSKLATGDLDSTIATGADATTDAQQADESAAQLAPGDQDDSDSDVLTSLSSYPRPLSQPAPQLYRCSFCWHLFRRPCHLVGSSRIACRKCWAQIWDLAVCWGCGEMVLGDDDGEGGRSVSFGWCWWHRACLGCLICRTPLDVDSSATRVELEAPPLCDMCEDELSLITPEKKRDLALAKAEERMFGEGESEKLERLRRSHTRTSDCILRREDAAAGTVPSSPRLNSQTPLEMEMEVQMETPKAIQYISISNPLTEAPHQPVNRLKQVPRWMSLLPGRRSSSSSCATTAGASITPKKSSGAVPTLPGLEIKPKKRDPKATKTGRVRKRNASAAVPHQSSRRRQIRESSAATISRVASPTMTEHPWTPGGNKGDERPWSPSLFEQRPWSPRQIDELQRPWSPDEQMKRCIEEVKASKGHQRVKKTASGYDGLKAGPVDQASATARKLNHRPSLYLNTAVVGGDGTEGSHGRRKGLLPYRQPTKSTSALQVGSGASLDGTWACPPHTPSLLLDPRNWSGR